MLKGLTSQFTNSVTPMPRMCLPTSRMAEKSTLSSIGMIITQINTPTGKLTCGHFHAANGLKHVWQQLPKRNARDDAQKHPHRQIALKHAHRCASRKFAGHFTLGTHGSRSLFRQLLQPLHADRLLFQERYQRIATGVAGRNGLNLTQLVVSSCL